MFPVALEGCLTGLAEHNGLGCQATEEASLSCQNRDGSGPTSGRWVSPGWVAETPAETEQTNRKVGISMSKRSE